MELFESFRQQTDKKSNLSSQQLTGKVTCHTRVSPISHAFWLNKKLLVSDFEVVPFSKPTKNDEQNQMQHITPLFVNCGDSYLHNQLHLLLNFEKSGHIDILEKVLKNGSLVIITLRIV